jgi:addiction module HigA family antidote
VDVATEKIQPIHPGEILLDEFLVPLGITQYRLAKDIRVPQPRISQIIRGERSITADTALRLSRYFGTSERFWLNLQARYDLERQKDLFGKRLDRDVPVLSQMVIKDSASSRYGHRGPGSRPRRAGRLAAAKKK